MPFLIRNEKLRKVNKTKRSSNIFDHEDLISIKSGLSINSNDNDNVSEGYEEIREILLSNQNLKQPKPHPSTLNEKKILPFIKPSSFLQSSSYLTDNSQQSINGYSNSYPMFSSKQTSLRITRITKNEKLHIPPPTKVTAEIHTFSFEALNNNNDNVKTAPRIEKLLPEITSKTSLKLPYQNKQVQKQKKNILEIVNKMYNK